MSITNNLPIPLITKSSRKATIETTTNHRQIVTIKEKRKKEKLEEVKARLDFGDARKKSTKAQESAYSESRTISPRRQRRSRSSCRNPSVFTRLRLERLKIATARIQKKKRRGREQPCSRGSEAGDGVPPRIPIAEKYSVEDDDLSQPWVCAETDLFTSRIRHFDFPKTRMPSHVKTYNGSEDPEDHLKIFQAATKIEAVGHATMVSHV
ncbi:hypothetical protein Tco_0975800 [Tanacetum coccineum]|uniref:Reverse transcriptase domain-containing protein n=1 Tax=Tanacetum coccineum TaxID=301880 RepID=A0ABQ5EFQ5_9ASTR